MQISLPHPAMLEPIQGLIFYENVSHFYVARSVRVQLICKLLCVENRFSRFVFIPYYAETQLVMKFLKC